MESPGDDRGAKYIEGYLEKKLDGKWINYWAVVQGSAVFFFRDPNTHLRENLAGGLEIGCQCVHSPGKSKKDCFEFTVKIGKTGKKHLFRVKSEILRQQWLCAIDLAVQCKPPGPLPGETGFDSLSDHPSPTSDYHTIPNIDSADTQPTCAVVAPGLNDIELQKKVTLQRTPMSFSAFYKRKGNKEKKGRKVSQEVEHPEGPRPESEGAAVSPAVADGRLYDDFDAIKPPWYLGTVTRCAAEEYLQDQPPGTFLVRDREIGKTQGAYTLSLKHFERCRHHKIDTTEQGSLIIKGHDHKTFPTLELLVEFFIQSQKKEIQLRPYVPEESVAHKPDTEPDASSDLPSPSRTQGDGCEEEIRETQSQIDQMKITDARTVRNPYENLPPSDKSGPPPLPSRRTSAPPGYENIPEKAVQPLNKKHSYSGSGYQNIAAKGPPQLPTRQGSSGYQNIPPKRASTTSYENIPEKGSPTTTDAPQLPARRPSGPQGYENIPSKPPVSADASPERKRSSGVSSPPPSIGYENVPPRSGAVAPPPLPPRGFKTEAQNILPPDLHPRSYQNLPPRAKPRSLTVAEEPPPLSARPMPPRRADTLPVLPVRSEIH